MAGIRSSRIARLATRPSTSGGNTREEQGTRDHYPRDEEAMNIRDNAPLEQSEEKFVRLEELLNVSLDVFEVTLLPR